MANVLKIKSRQTGSAGAPASLARAELAYNEQDNTLYIGHGSGTDSNRTKNAIAGVGAFVDLASSQALTNKDLTDTTNTFPAAGAAQAGVVELATDQEANTGTDATRAVTPDNLGAWTGNTAITSVGTIGTGVWSGTALVAGKVPNLEDLTVGGNIDVNAKRITNLAAPTHPNDAARKTDVDSAVQGLDVRESVKYASTANVSNPTSNQSSAHTIDGQTVVDGDRVLLKDQTTASQNGIYEVSYEDPNWSMSRAADLNADADCSANMFFFVEAGSTYADTGWVCTTNAPTLANLVFAQFSGTGSYTAEDGLDITGTAFGIADGGVTLARMADMATDSILGRDSAGTGAPEVLNAATARSVIGVDAAGTDNSTDVTIAGEDYLSLTNQVLTANEVDLTDNVTGTLPIGSGGTGLADFAAGDLLYGKGTGEGSFSTLAAGTDKYILTNSNGTPAWTNAPDALTIDCGTF